MAFMETVLGGDDTIRRNFSKVEELFGDLYDPSTATGTGGALAQVTNGLAVWRPIAEISGAFGGGVAAGGFIPRETGNQVAPATGTLAAGRIIRFDANYVIPGRTAQLRVLTTMQTNATAAGASVVFSFSLIEITASAGGAGVVTLTTAGAATVFGQVTNPAASSLLTVDSLTSGSAAPVSAPAAGQFALFVTLSGAATAANHGHTHTIQLQLRHV